MKIGDVREGQRVRWRERCGRVLYVQPVGVAPDLAAEDAADEAARAAGHSCPHIVTPRGVWHGGVRRRRGVLVCLDPAPTDTARCTYVEHAHFLWCTPRALRPEVER